MSLRDAINTAAATGLKFEDVDVPEWGVKVRVREITGTDRDAYEAKAIALRNAGQDVELRLANFRSRLVVLCLFDPESDERIYDDASIADGSAVRELGASGATVIQRLFKVAQRLSGMDSDALGRAEGNSESGPSDGSTTG